MEEKNEMTEEQVTPEADAPKEESKKEKKCKESKEEKKLREENEKLTASLAELTDRYTRMLAEYDNFRKRAQKEREGVYVDATSDVLNAIFPVKDSLEMALRYADESPLSQGLTMTLGSFDEILKKLGVESFGAEGEEFDPNLHNAVLHVDDDTMGEGVIAEVLQKGYKKGEKIIRYAMVKVAN